MYATAGQRLRLYMYWDQGSPQPQITSSNLTVVRLF